MKKLFCFLSLVMALLICACGSSTPAPESTPVAADASSEVISSYDDFIDKYRFADYNSMVADPSDLVTLLGDVRFDFVPSDYHSWELTDSSDYYDRYSSISTLFGRTMTIEVSESKTTSSAYSTIRYDASRDLIAELALSLYKSVYDLYGQPTSTTIEGTDCTAAEFEAFMNDIPESSFAFCYWYDESSAFSFSIGLSSFGDYEISFP